MLNTLTHHTHNPLSLTLGMILGVVLLSAVILALVRCGVPQPRPRATPGGA